MKISATFIIKLICLLISLGLTSGASAKIYQWKDRNGEVVFSDKPPPNSGKTINKVKTPPIQKTQQPTNVNSPATTVCGRTEKEQASYIKRLEELKENNRLYLSVLEPYLEAKKYIYKSVVIDEVTIPEIKQIVELHRLEDEFELASSNTFKYTNADIMLSKGDNCRVPVFLIDIGLPYSGTPNFDRFSNLDINDSGIKYDDIFLFQRKGLSLSFDKSASNKAACSRPSKERRLYSKLMYKLNQSTYTARRIVQGQITDIAKQKKVLTAEMKANVTINKPLYLAAVKQLKELDKNRKILREKERRLERFTSTYIGINRIDGVRHD